MTEWGFCTSNVDFEGERNFKSYSLGLTLSGFHFSEGIICYFVNSCFKAKFWFRYTGQNQCIPEKQPRGREGSFGSDIRILKWAHDMAQSRSEHVKSWKRWLILPTHVVGLSRILLSCPYLFSPTSVLIHSCAPCRELDLPYFLFLPLLVYNQLGTKTRVARRGRGPFLAVSWGRHLNFSHLPTACWM